MSWMGIWNSLIHHKTETRRVDPGSVLKVVFCQGEDGFVIAECPQLPGCMSQGRTKKEAARNIVDAIESVLIVRMCNSRRKPPPTSAAPRIMREKSRSALKVRS